MKGSPDVHPPASPDAPQAAAAGETLADFLAVEPAGLDRFLGRCNGGVHLQVFGGHLTAQALMAAGHTVDARRAAHSVHGYFLRGADSRRRIGYAVERLRDGGVYSVRRVTASQDGEAVFTLTASFKRPEDEDWDRHSVMPDVPAPQEVADTYLRWAELNPREYQAAAHAQVVAMHIVPSPAHGVAAEGGQTQQYAWFRPRDPLPGDPLTHAAALTYLSDLSLGPTAALDREVLYPLREGRPRLILASLDHAIWIHRPFRADDWLLFAQRSTTVADRRGFSRGEFWTRDGRLVASAAQETVLRPLPPGRDNGSAPTGT